MSIYKGTTLIAGALPNAANQDLSNLSQTGQAVIDGKADTDLTNVTDTGYIKMAGASMPSNRYIDLTLGASGASYTAPANGYYCLYKIASGSNQFIQMCNVGYNNKSVTNMVIRSVGNDGYIGCTMPCAKGQQITINYTLGGNTVYFRFCYAQGSESEA
jgi:hypothetical protein